MQTRVGRRNLRVPSHRALASCLSQFGPLSSFLPSAFLRAFSESVVLIRLPRQPSSTMLLPPSHPPFWVFSPYLTSNWYYHSAFTAHHVLTTTRCNTAATLPAHQVISSGASTIFGQPARVKSVAWLPWPGFRGALLHPSLSRLPI